MHKEPIVPSHPGTVVLQVVGEPAAYAAGPPMAA